MNLILFENTFESIWLEREDPRAQHLRKVLRVKVGDTVFLGFVNGSRARAKVVSIAADSSIELKVVEREPSPQLLPIVMMIGLPRPHTARRILFEAASMGVAEMHFFTAERSEPSYAKSHLWQTHEWRERLLRGTEQAFGTRLPEVVVHADFESALAGQAQAAVYLALDNYEADQALGECLPDVCDSVVVALGPERGWSGNERAVFREHEWKLAHLGPHVLRAETACVATVAAVATKLSLWRAPTRTSL